MMTSQEVAERAQLTRRKSLLTWYEEQIVKTGNELASLFRKLRDEKDKPYLATHPTFEAYCQDRWNMTPRRAQQLMAADSVRAQLADIEDLAPVVQSMKTGAVSELATLPKEQRIAVLREAIQMPQKPGVITGAKIKAARIQLIEGGPAAPAKPACCPTCKQPLP